MNPTHEDLRALELALGTFLASRNGAARNVMQGAMRSILDRYGLNKITLDRFKIERGRYGGVRIIPRSYTNERHCPWCGESLYGHGCTVLTVLEEEEKGDIVSYGCQCGYVVGKWEGKT